MQQIKSLALLTLNCTCLEWRMDGSSQVLEGFESQAAPAWAGSRVQTWAGFQVPVWFGSRVLEKFEP